MTGPNLGPSRALLERLGRAEHSPLLMGMPFAVRKALERRVIAVREFDQLSDADQELIEAGEREVSAGLSPTLQNPADWGGDWAAEDLAVQERRERGERKVLEADLEAKRFNPTQPRYPAGHPRAGEWMELGDVSRWLGGQTLRDGSSSADVQSDPELADSTAAPSGSERFNQHDDVTVRTAAAILTPPAGYAHPRVLNAPAAKDLAAPKQTRAVSFRPGDVMEHNGARMSVVTNRLNKESGRQELVLVDHDGEVHDLDVPPTQTLTSIARSPHPTVVGDARRVVAAAAKGEGIPPAPSLRGDVGRRSAVEDAELRAYLADTAADFEQPDRDVTPADLEQWRSEWSEEFDAQAEADALSFAAEDDAFLAGWGTEWYSRPWAVEDPAPTPAAPAPRAPRAPDRSSQQARDDYELYVESQYAAARTATNGRIFSRDGELQLDRQEQAGYSGPILDDYSLFRGQLPRKYASEELLSWFEDNGRMTFAQFRSQATGRDSDQRTARAGQAFQNYKALDVDGWAGI